MFVYSYLCNNVGGNNTMLWTIIAVLLVLWIFGFIGEIGGGLIHLLLLAAAIVLVYNLVAGRRTV